ncbi:MULTISPECIES: sigma-70 family RNA polymerase sigma factor [Corynebacterium]|uniref:RNA polymerase sigma factor n=2 Tax=Corynebacterium aurimucosum TaxID=169292 RepID=C3PL04_CORA7|nr:MULTISPECIES: sigma-70 family RNA polymerase sigma factor [Corynebacterium]ACP34120.1 RNA polymerase sigma factor [Corynebacterium aurimucosum ATCC 700975]MBU5654943.1 sigma-70 family RNA polymerase sigma factor [Corynebacterium aurimucosum]MDK6813690.1 sigma-70 family RNA polymerase sigma factor [Corynebacterium sp. UMB6689]OFL24006.1 RNA polymerase subunit sigma [Corynebacterium sp. HMSC062A03]OFN77082.1 RNA polymerase subunit sigma [Corynebacterium sp. HMSC074E01]
MSAQPTDRELVDAFIGGDTKAFSAIVEKHRARLTAMARRYTRNDDDAQDIVQEALLKASCNMASYRHDATLSTWLHRLVMNSGYDFLNHRSNRENASLDAEIIEDDRNYALAHNPSENLAERITVAQAMETLRQDQREALYLTDVAGYPIDTVAKVQGVAPGTVKSRRARARQVLRAAID